MLRTALPLALTAFILTACSSAPPERVDANMTVEKVAAVPPPPPTGANAAAPLASAPAITVRLSPNGLSFIGGDKPHHVAFGVPRTTIEASMDAALGKPGKRGTSAECSAGAMDFSDYRGGLKLTFQEGKFIGWTINREKTKDYAAAGGIGIGSTRKDVEKIFDVSVQETSLGTEFGDGHLAGLLDGTGPEAKVTDIWAGTVCILD